MKTFVGGEGREVVLNMKWKIFILKTLHFPKNFWITLIESEHVPSADNREEILGLALNFQT